MVVTVLAAVVLGLLGLAPLSAAVAFGGILAAGVIAFVVFVAVAFGAPASVAVLAAWSVLLAWSGSGPVQPAVG